MKAVATIDLVFGGLTFSSILLELDELTKVDNLNTIRIFKYFGNSSLRIFLSIPLQLCIGLVRDVIWLAQNGNSLR